ncbi:MAG: helix-turn-helix domain-containing protein [Candidatus Natronoplasma sp.]
MSDEEEIEEKDLKEDIEALQKQINGLETMLNNLINMHRNVLERASAASELEERYMKMLSIYKKFGNISPARLSGIKDPISEKIVEILFDKEGLNITQITGRLRKKKGTASRHTVRKKLKILEKEGIVKKTTDGKGKSYQLTEKAINRWAEMLGIKKID